MSIHTFDAAARQDTRRPMNSAVLRVLGVAALSMLFALIDCVGQAGPHWQFPAALAGGAVSSIEARVVADTPADSFDRRADPPTRRN